MGLTAVNSTVNSASPIHALVQFTAGTHGSLLSPAPPANCSQDASLYGAVTLEMQSESLSFLGSDGHTLQINNSPPGLIK